MNTRTRFAPSPTGLLHVGGIRTALFAWLIAKQSGGKFILRLEDTDQAREVTGADQHIMDSLNALGLQYDEGPDIGGSFAPYRQSQRLSSYKKWAQKLIDQGRAYADPYSPQEVDNFRQQAKNTKVPFLYRNHRPKDPPEWDGSQPLRFKSDPKPYKWHDAVMGDLSAGAEVIDDFIIIKSDGFPTYNFAHIIDDVEMQISHVIRGQEFLASTPNYLNLYEALAINKPILATMPHILGPTGTKKLSKRDGAKDVLDYIRDGYLPEALINFIASLGWNDGTEQEIFTVDELIQKFSLDRVQKSGARFDEQRLLWLNGAHIRNLSLDNLYQNTQSYWPKSSQNYDDKYKKRVLEITQERLKIYSELPELTNFFFIDPTNEDVNSLLNDNKNKQLKKITLKDKIKLLTSTILELENSDFSVTDLEQRLNSLLTKLDTKPGILFSIIRIATTGAPYSPGLFDTLNVLGKDTSLQRIRHYLDTNNHN
ncbi:glutamate--tRNA ligase [Candidatus Saccharibacteria bacterium]|nr:glutamate--tRNA ligase [Candidatus Saccharibacteria bacterium]